MVRAENESVAIFSIQPKFASAILSGVKRVEFRKTKLRPTLSCIIVYASSPVRRVIGTFRVAAVEYATPVELWDTYRLVGGISEAEFMGYFRGSALGFAILIGEVRQLQTPLKLNDLDPNLHPPQSFQYVRPGMLEVLSPDLAPAGLSPIVEGGASTLGFSDPHKRPAEERSWGSSAVTTRRELSLNPA
jgi:predicted transcriptional regulator